MITFVGTRRSVARWEKRSGCVTEPQKRTTGTPNMLSSSFQTLVSKGNSRSYYHNKRTPFNLLTCSYGLRTTFNLQASTARLFKRKLKSGDLDHHPQLTTFLLKFWPTSSIFPSKHPHHSVLDMVINVTYVEKHYSQRTTLLENHRHFPFSVLSFVMDGAEKSRGCLLDIFIYDSRERYSLKG